MPSPEKYKPQKRGKRGLSPCARLPPDKKKIEKNEEKKRNNKTRQQSITACPKLCAPYPHRPKPDLDEKAIYGARQKQMAGQTKGAREADGGRMDMGLMGRWGAMRRWEDGHTDGRIDESTTRRTSTRAPKRTGASAVRPVLVVRYMAQHLAGHSPCCIPIMGSSGVNQ